MLAAEVLHTFPEDKQHVQVLQIHGNLECSRLLLLAGLDWEEKMFRPR